jgi:predicted small lipoprotein YifL
MDGTIMRRVAVILLSLLALQACGTKGALYLPPQEAKQAQPDNKQNPR